jgi:hypothetical protein
LAIHQLRDVTGNTDDSEAVSEDIDQLGTPYIDDANPNTAGKIWLGRLLEVD